MNFEFWSFEFVWDLGFVIWNFISISPQNVLWTKNKLPFSTSNIQLITYHLSLITFILMRLIIQILTNALSIFLADYLLDGFVFTGNILTLMVSGFILGLINFFLKPILKIITAPLYILTLGLFSIVINMFLLYILDYLVPELSITGIWTYFWASIIISAVNIFIGKTLKKGV